MIKITSLILTFLSLNLVFSQNKQIDSLKVALEAAKSDTARITALIGLAYEANDDPEQQLSYAIQAYELGKEVNSVKHKSRSELVLGLFYSSSNLDSAIVFMESGAQRYLANELFNYAVNAKYIIDKYLLTL